MPKLLTPAQSALNSAYMDFERARKDYSAGKISPDEFFGTSGSVMERIQRAVGELKYECFCPIDYKYYHPELVPYISAAGEVRGCAKVHVALMRGLEHFGLATPQNVAEAQEALDRISPANVFHLESEVTKHDQLALIKEMEQYVSASTGVRMHPGTTSYDILDTARAMLYRDCMRDVFLP